MLFRIGNFLLTTVLSYITSKLKLISSEEEKAAPIDFNYSGIIYSVNGIVGGSKQVGMISDAGLYSPPLVNSNQIVTLSASPVEAPTFKAELNIEVRPIIID